MEVVIIIGWVFAALAMVGGVAFLAVMAYRYRPPVTARTVIRAESERAGREAERRWQEEEQWRLDHLNGCPCEAKERRRQ